jgi:hypothetical protein
MEMLQLADGLSEMLPRLYADNLARSKLDVIDSHDIANNSPERYCFRDVYPGERGLMCGEKDERCLVVWVPNTIVFLRLYLASSEELLLLQHPDGVRKLITFLVMQHYGHMGRQVLDLMLVSFDEAAEGHAREMAALIDTVERYLAQERGSTSS